MIPINLFLIYRCGQGAGDDKERRNLNLSVRDGATGGGDVHLPAGRDGVGWER